MRLQLPNDQQINQMWKATYTWMGKSVTVRDAATMPSS
jgi:hypothetical protein